jgi:hypothetical protein
MVPPFVVCRGCPGSGHVDSSRGRRNRQPQLKGSAAAWEILRPGFTGGRGGSGRSPHSPRAPPLPYTPCTRLCKEGRATCVRGTSNLWGHGAAQWEGEKRGASLRLALSPPQGAPRLRSTPAAIPRPRTRRRPCGRRRVDEVERRAYRGPRGRPWGWARLLVTSAFV